MTEPENQNLFNNYCAWFSISVQKETIENWEIYGGKVTENFEDAVFIFSDNQRSADTIRIFQNVENKHLVVFKSSWINDVISFSKSSMLSTKGIEKYILLPEDLEEELKLYTDFEKWQIQYVNSNNYNAKLARRTLSTTVSNQSKKTESVTNNESSRSNRPEILINCEPTQLNKQENVISCETTQSNKQENLINCESSKKDKSFDLKQHMKSNYHSYSTDDCFNTNDSKNNKTFKNNVNSKGVSVDLFHQPLKEHLSPGKKKNFSPTIDCFQDGFSRNSPAKSIYNLRHSKSTNDVIKESGNKVLKTPKKSIDFKVETLPQSKCKVLIPNILLTPIKLNKSQQQSLTPSKNNMDGVSKKKNKSVKSFSSEVIATDSDISDSIKLTKRMQPKRARKSNINYEETSDENKNDDTSLNEDSSEEEREFSNKKRKRKLYKYNQHLVDEILTPVTVNMVPLIQISPTDISNTLNLNKNSFDRKDNPSSSKGESKNKDISHKKTADVMKEHIKTMKHKRMGVKNVDDFVIGSFAGFNHIDDLDIPDLMLEDFIVNKCGCRVTLRELNV